MEAHVVVRVLVRTLAVLGCVAMVVIAHQTVGWTNLAVMLAGLVGLLVVLYAYNRSHQ